MSFKLSKFVIKKLFGENTYEILIQDNKLILVAENGSGKTTIVNILYYFLSKQWGKLLQYDFESIIAVINGESIEIHYADIEQSATFNIRHSVLKNYSPRVREKLLAITNNYDIWELKDQLQLRKIADKYNISTRIIYEFIDTEYFNTETLFSSKIKEYETQLTSSIKELKILYLPTYRRIEQELKNIFPEFDDEYVYEKRKLSQKNEELGYVELIEFGMEDVKKKTNEALHKIQDDFNNNLKNNLTGTYLRDIINEKYKELDTFDKLKDFDDDSLDNVFNRIDNTILAQKEKLALKSFVRNFNSVNPDDVSKIKAYFIYRLLEIYNELRKEEEDIYKFVDICNAYLSNKALTYDNINFAIKIFSNRGEKGELELQDLSSGEKQIVSLFSHLFFSKKHNLIIIDEPELSLSVPWQRKFLIDVEKTGYCKGLIAVTHSPFIFENELDTYAHGLDEFSI